MRKKFSIVLFCYFVLVLLFGCVEPPMPFTEEELLFCEQDSDCTLTAIGNDDESYCEICCETYPVSVSGENYLEDYYAKNCPNGSRIMCDCAYEQRPTPKCIKNKCIIEWNELNPTFDEDGVEYEIDSATDFRLIAEINLDINKFKFNKIDDNGEELFSVEYAESNICTSRIGYDNFPAIPNFYCELKANVIEEKLDIKLYFEEKEYLGKYDLAVLNSCPNCVGCECDTHDKYVGKNINYDSRSDFGKTSFSQGEISYAFMPFEYIPGTKELFVYKKINVYISGDVSSGTVIEKLSFDDSGIKKKGEILTASAKLMNKSGKYEYVCLNVEDSNKFSGRGTLIESKCATINSGESKNFDVNFTIPLEKSDFFDYLNYYDYSNYITLSVLVDKNEIYKHGFHTTTRPMEIIIVDYNAPKEVSPDSMEEKFVFTIKNGENNRKTVFLNTIIYNGGSGMSLVKDLLQNSFEIGSGETIVFEDKWNPKIFYGANPDALKPGQHIAQTTIDVEGYIQTITNYFNVVFDVDIGSDK